MAPDSSTLAWKIPWTEEPGRLRSLGPLRVHTTECLHFHFSLSYIGEGNGNPLQCSCLENPRDRGAWWAANSGVAQSQTRLMRLSSSSSMSISSNALLLCFFSLRFTYSSLSRSIMRFNVLLGLADDWSFWKYLFYYDTIPSTPHLTCGLVPHARGRIPVLTFQSLWLFQTPPSNSLGWKDCGFFKIRVLDVLHPN